MKLGSWKWPGALLLAVGLVCASWFAGKLFGHRMAEAQKSEKYEETRTFLETETQDFAVGSFFPDFDLVNVNDHTTTTVHDELPGGGLLVYFISGCEGCDEELQSIKQAVDQLEHSRPVVLISPEYPIVLSEWMYDISIDLPVFQDADLYIKSQYRIIMTPSIVFLDEKMQVKHNNTGGWDVEDYRRLLELPPEELKSEHATAQTP